MKKAKILLLGILLATAAAGKTAVETKAYSSFPDVGSRDAASYFACAYFDYGTKRYDDRAVLITLANGWGVRGSVQKTYDINDFGYSVNLDNMQGNTALAVIFSSGKDAYMTAGDQIVMDVVRSTSDEHLYEVTLSTSTHNVSIPNFTDGGVWADDANYTGVSVTALDNNIAVSFKTVGEIVTVSVNGVAYNVNKADVFAKVSDPTATYISMGMFNGAGTSHWGINYIEDASDRAYFGATGQYTVAKNALSELEMAISGGLETQAKIDAAKVLADNVKLDTLKAWDKAYLETRLNAANTAINAAITILGPTAIVAAYESALTSLENGTSDLSSLALVDAALALKADAIAKQDAVIALGTLDASLQTRYDEANIRLDAALGKISVAVPAVYETYVSAYETAANVASSATDISDARKAKAAIPANLTAILTEADMLSFSARISAADAKLVTTGKAQPEGWTLGANGYATKDDSTHAVGLTMSGSSLNVAPSEGNALFYGREKLSAANFRMSFDINELNSAAGAWLSFGLMEKAELFSNADDATCQSNKGIFFLITSYDNNNVSVQAYILTLTSNRFFDAVLAQTITLPLAETINVEFKEVTKSIAGVSDTYFEMHFNDKSFDQEVIKATKIMTALGTSKSGYLYVGSNAGTTVNPFTVTIKSVNGFNPDAASLVNEIIAAPVTSDTQKSYRLGTVSDVIFNFDTKGQEITEVKIGSSVLTSGQYSYASGKLTVKASVLETLAVGDTTVTVTTAGGSASVALTVLEALPIDDGGDDKDLPTGAIVGIVAGSVAVAAGLAVGGYFLIKKKKH